MASKAVNLGQFRQRRLKQARALLVGAFLASLLFPWLNVQFNWSGLERQSNLSFELYDSRVELGKNGTATVHETMDVFFTGVHEDFTRSLSSLHSSSPFYRIEASHVKATLDGKEVKLHTDWQGTVKHYRIEEKLSGAHKIEYTFQLKGVQYPEDAVTYFRWRALPFSWNAEVDAFRGVVIGENLGDLQCWTSEAEKPEEEDLCELKSVPSGAEVQYTPEYGEPVRYKIELDEPFAAPKFLPWPAQADGSFGRSLLPGGLALALTGIILLLLRRRPLASLMPTRHSLLALRGLGVSLVVAWLVVLWAPFSIPAIWLLPLSVLFWYFIPLYLAVNEAKLYSLTDPESEESKANIEEK